MTKAELLEIIKNGENSGVEFKRDDIRPKDLAKEISALLNFEGGYILLGVEDDGTISGLTRDPRKTEEWVTEICRVHVEPAIIPYWESITLESGEVVGIITLPADSPDKPYKAKRNSHWQIYIRVGTTSREARREEERRLHQASGLMRYDISPVPGTSQANLERRRLENYFRDILRQDCPPPNDQEAWETVLLNTDILIANRGHGFATVGGLLLFGENPNRNLPQAGITATAYPREQKEYATVDEDVVRGPLVSVYSRRGKLVETGVIDRAVQFIARNMGTTAWLDNGRRRRKKAFPIEAVRESIVNAVTHRDYTIAVTDIEVSLYSDRVEVISPGRLPNGVTVEKMKRGVVRAARNGLLKDILRDYGYMEHRALGVPELIVRAMREHNGTEPDLIEEETRFIVRLWKETPVR
jgi:ATP-dependent DNA helicase RecG